MSIFQRFDYQSVPRALAILKTKSWPAPTRGSSHRPAPARACSPRCVNAKSGVQRGHSAKKQAIATGNRPKNSRVSTLCCQKWGARGHSAKKQAVATGNRPKNARVSTLCCQKWGALWTLGQKTSDCHGQSTKKSSSVHALLSKVGCAVDTRQKNRRLPRAIDQKMLECPRFVTKCVVYVDDGCPSL